MSIPTGARSAFVFSGGDKAAKRDAVASLFWRQAATAPDDKLAYFTASKVSSVALPASFSTSCLPLIWKLATFSSVCR